jgi:DNA polymerase III delta prime subunit
MQQLIDSYNQSKNLHHAYFLVGEGEQIFLELKDFLEKSVEVKTLGNPDFWYGKFDTLKIDEARQIAESQERKSFNTDKSGNLDTACPSRKIFVIQTDFITEEAQNALLKVFEEPTVGTHFFIISPQDMLLPTLRSRMVVIVESQKSIKSESILGTKFSERLARVKEITEAIKDEEATKQDAIAFINQVEMELHSQGVVKSARALEVCELARASLYDRGAPIKIILENVMLSI